MPSDKEIFYSILDREIDNLIGNNPVLGMFSGAVKNMIYKKIEPYINLFLEDGKLQTDMASEFLTEEATSKIEKFKKEFKSKQDG